MPGMGMLDFFHFLTTSDCIFFFFQAEDGIRDSSVTGVQTCALPIYERDRERDGRRFAGALSKEESSPIRNRGEAPTITFSIALMRKKICRFWNVRWMPRRARSATESEVMSSPRWRIEPLDGP